MKKFFIFFCVISIFFLSFLQWPLKDPILLRTFGSNEENQYAKGILFTSDSNDVFPIDSGELLFYSDTGLNTYSLPGNLGNYAVLEHASHIRCLYSGLENPWDPQLGTAVDQNTCIGKTKNGESNLRSLKIFIFDKNAAQLENPLLRLPLLNDTEKPVIKNIMTVSDNQTVEIKNGMILPPGTYPLYAEIYDPILFGKNYYQKTEFFCAPYQIILRINGSEKFNLKYDLLKEYEQTTVLSVTPLLPFTQYYQSLWNIYLGNIQLKSDIINIELLAKDYSGNVTVNRVEVYIKY